VEHLHFSTGTISFSWDAEKGLFSTKITAKRPTKVVCMLPAIFQSFRWHHDAARARIVALDPHHLRIEMETETNLSIFGMPAGRGES
jgi:hypothetical protein